MLSINQLLERNSKLHRLIATSYKITELNHLLKMAINDQELAKHCSLAKQQRDQLVLVVDNAAWATRLRYMTPDILKSLHIHPEFANIKTIRYRVAPQSISKPTPPRKKALKPTISPTSAELIRAGAKFIKHPRLKEALLRLGRK